MNQKVNISTNVTSVSFTPLARLGRTVIQILIAVGLAIPIILNTPAVSGNATLAKTLGVVGALIASVSAVWNALESLGYIPSIGGKPSTPIVANVVASKELPTPKPIPSL